MYPAPKRVYPRPSRLSNALAAVSSVAWLGVMGNLFYRLPSQAEGGIDSLTSFVSKNLVAMLLCGLPCMAGIIADCRAQKRQSPATSGI